MPFIVNDEMRRQAKRANDRVQPLFGRMSSIKSAYDLAKEETLGAFLDVQLGKSEAESKSNKMISASEANKMFPEVEESFKEDVNIEVARFLAKRQRKKRLLEAKMALGPNDFLQSTLNFGSSFAAQMSDPVNIGAGMAAGAGLAGAVARLPFVGSAVQAGLRSGPISASLTREFIGNLAIEPLNIAGARAAQDRITLSDSVMNVTAGTLMGGMLDFGISKAFNFGKDFKNGKVQDKFNAAKGQLDGDTSVRLDKPGDLDINSRINFDKINIDTNFTFKKFNSSRIPRAFKSTSSSIDVSGIKGNIKSSLSTDKFVQLTDNPKKAVKSVLGTSKKKGRVIETNSEDLNLIDADRDFSVQPKDIQDFMKNDLGKSKGTLKQAIDSTPTSKSPEVLSKLENTITEKGFDGFHFVDKDVSGDKSNVFNLTPEAVNSKFNDTSTAEITPNSVRNKEANGKVLAREHFDTKKNPGNSLTDSVEDIRLSDEVSGQPKTDVDLEAEASPSSDIEPILNQEFKSQEAKKIMEQSKKEFESLETEAQSAKAFIHCMGN